MEPAPYPPNNAEERKAVNIFNDLVDSTLVKADVRILDNVPNHDGSVELVDEQQRPIGSLKVQIKKIPDNALRYDCPIELVAYSERVSLPFILICVDVGNRKAYWRHLSPVMAGLKPEQKTFTVTFQPTVDGIGHGFPYFERWRLLCVDYLERISEYRELRRIVDEEIGLNKLTPEDRGMFQQFIEEVNILLDVDVPVVKHEGFANTWKLGVSIHHVDAESVYYSIYTVLKGENAPLLTHIPRSKEPPKVALADGAELGKVTALNIDHHRGNEVSIQWATKAEFENPVKAARKFVLRHLNRLMGAKRLHVHGRNQSVELLMWFMGGYAHTLGLPEADVYKTADISYGLNVFLPMWYSLAYPCMVKYFRTHFGEALGSNPFPSFEQIANSSLRTEHPPEAEVRRAIASQRQLTAYLARMDSFSFQSLLQAVDFLMAADIREISREDRPPSRAGRWTWDCYSPEELKHNVVVMLKGAAEDYTDFIKGNRFGRLDSPLVTRDVALVFAADPQKWAGSQMGPTVEGYWVENTDRSLPVITFIDLSKDPDAFRREDRVVVVHGVSRRWTRSWNPVSRYFHERLRIQAVLYELLKIDLEHRFGQRL